MAATESMYLGDISDFPQKLCDRQCIQIARIRSNAADRFGARSGLADGESQAQGGRNGGLAVWGCNELLGNDTGRLPRSDGKRIKEADICAMPKQLTEHVAIEEQQSSMAFCGGTCSGGQQSCIPSTEADTSEIAADFEWRTAAPPAAGSMATDNVIKKTRMVRASFMVRAARP
jgi:hypothetical protein